MREDEIKFEYAKKALEIENHWMDLSPPREIRELYMLVELIQLQNLEKYFLQFGFEQLDPETVHDGKLLMRWEPLSGFERECIELLNAEVKQRERTTSHSKPLSSITHMRAFA